VVLLTLKLSKRYNLNKSKYLLLFTMTALKANLKQTLDHLTEEQLQQVNEYIAFLKFRDQQNYSSYLTEHRDCTPAERAASFLRWARSHQPSGFTLPDEAFSRESIYAE
jgi:hypothetical protein